MSTETATNATQVVVCNEDDLAVGEARRFDVGDHRLAIVRGHDCWFAINDKCSHADFSLAEGDVDLDDCTIECWKHGSFFSLTTGAAETLPATRPVTVYPVVVEGGEVLVTIQTPNTGGAGGAS
jgi:3-phenylpropionate/trans-cinnamate dioxygenase ferredoxin subunit